MNYIAAFMICLVGTVMAALSYYPNVKMLLISDVNVALHLWLAWWLGRRKQGAVS